ncbi:MAG: PP2C family protein-serine/threonine phosphatase [Hyphomicrobiaceae bacterium]
MLKFVYAGRASQGARAYQEDAADVWPGSGPLASAVKGAPLADTALLAVLADGMGGHVGGSLASNMVCGVFLECFARGDHDLVMRLAQSLDAANTAILKKVTAQPHLNGMGSTFVAVAFGPAGAHWISVGDSPMYLFRKGELTRVNEDHSLAPLLDKLAADGRMDVDVAKNDPRRHYLRSAVTGEELDLIDASKNPLALAPGDTVLLASDGILTLSEDDIRRRLQAYKDDTVETIADGLLRDVESAGDPHQDNTTLIVVRALTV